jgi:cytochrome c
MSRLTIAMIILVPLTFSACGGGDQEEQDAGPQQGGAGSELTAFELEHGIGPLTEPVELGDLDPQLAAEGEQLFALKCASCHQLDDRYIGPPLRTVLDERSPTYVMNMMLNPTEMTQKHPQARALLAEYLAPMPSQDLSMEEAGALLEYLRREGTNDTTPETEPTR